MNWPNRLSLLRVGLVPLVVLMICLGDPWSYGAALVLFLAGCLTDWADGWMARRYRIVTNFGKFMDPVADKLLVLSTMISLCGQGMIPAWACVAVSVPPAVAWPLYHLLAFDLPLNYVRLPAETIYVGHLSLWQRFGIPDWFARRTLFYTGVRKTDHNVWMQTLKTAVFDELTLFENGTVLWYVAYLLMALFAGLVLIGFVLFVRMLLRRPARLSGLGATFLGVYGAALVGNYVKFCVDYPYICSFNFRYIAPLLLLGALGIAAGRSRAHACAGRCLSAYTGLFAALATGVYAVWFFSPVR